MASWAICQLPVRVRQPAGLSLTVRLLHIDYDSYMTASALGCIYHTQKGASAASPKRKVCMCRQKCHARSHVRSHGYGCWHGSSLPSCSTCTTANSTPVNPLTVFYSVRMCVCLPVHDSVHHGLEYCLPAVTYFIVKIQTSCKIGFLKHGRPQTVYHHIACL